MSIDDTPTPLNMQRDGGRNTQHMHRLNQAEPTAEAATEELLEIIRQNRNWNDDAARLELLKIFEVLGPTDPITIAGRRKLSSILFS